MAGRLSFTEATDRYMAAGGTVNELAEVFGTRRETVTRWRSADPGRYRPPDDWAATVARAAVALAERKGREAEQLGRLAGDLRGP